ncbi:hypothetical protein F511_39782 [Dorcoceras hygrometricum]|uniref:Uncharacterized protein n=1 Tax=Dorcoceras hygrometricum TaxID=472368 RepID=A0A2Z7ANT9_9LAMI|nr:hypothetical protein F511_39782 [Dorcoceras hygrometricum]
MPELEELPTDEELQEVPVRNMVDRLEGHPHGQILEKNVVDMEDASKMMAEGIPVYVKAVVSHTTQSSSQGSFKHKGVEQGAGSSRAGKTRRSVPIHPALEERYTPLHRRDEPVYQRSSVTARGNESGNSRPHLQQPYGVTNPVNQPALIGYPRTKASGESSTTKHRLLHASGPHPIPPPDDPNRVGKRVKVRQLSCRVSMKFRVMRANLYNQDLGLNPLDKW